MNQAKQQFSLIRNFEKLSPIGLQKLQIIEEEFDRLALNKTINKLTCKDCQKYLKKQK